MRTAEKNGSIRHDGEGYRLLVAHDHEERASAEGLRDAAGFDMLMATARRVPGGRGSNRILESSGNPIRLRPNQHGGILAGWFGDHFLSPHRPFREFRIWTELRRRGVPLATPVFAVGRRRGLFWRTAFGSLDRVGAVDGYGWLETRPEPTRLRTACIALARALRRFHDAGGLHGDLQLRNILIESTPNAASNASVQLVLIDLDRARIRPRISARERFRELMRFARSLEKTGHTDLLSARLRALFLSSYCANNRGLRRSMLRWGPLEAQRAGRHRLGWWLGKHFFRTPGALAMFLTAIAILGLACHDDGIVDDRSDLTEEASWSLIVTGDTGRSSILPGFFEGQLSVAQAMTEEAKRDPVDGLVLLGDNFYWHGLDREHLVARIRMNLVEPYCYFLDLTGLRSREIEGACGIDASLRAPVELFAVLGNHDLELPESVALQRNAIPDFLPGWHMSHSLAQVYEVGPGISLILFESELAINDAEAIRRALLEAVSSARGPWRILATHRPVATDDKGFPPLGGYPAFVRDALAESGQSVQLVMAGHHHNLQAFEIGAPTPSLHIGVGSGSRARPPLAKEHPDARFGAIVPGFARVDLVQHSDSEERLSVRLFEAPRWPWIARFQDYRLRAHFEVDRLGRVSELPRR